MSKRLIIKPVPRKSVQGRDKHNFYYRDPDTGEEVVGTSLQKTKAITENGFSASERLCFLIKNQKVQAGMSEMVPNPWYIGEEKEEEKQNKINTLRGQYGLSEAWAAKLPQLLEREEISKQRELEILSGVEPDTYTELVPTPVGKHWKDQEDNYLSTFSFVFYDDANIISDETPRGRLAIQLVKNRPDKIAPNRDEANSAMHAFYIAEEQENIKRSVQVHSLTNRAIAKLVELEDKYPASAELYDWPIYQIASLCEYNNKPIVKGHVTPIFTIGRLNDYLKAKNFGGTDVNTFGINNGSVFWFAKKNKKEWYRFSTRNDLETFVYSELEKFNPKEPDMENGYKDLLEELRIKRAVVSAN